ncbi:MAG: phospholipid carrier-dependent glycosyltransferase [Fimbriimonadaceae bacterium]
MLGVLWTALFSLLSAFAGSALLKKWAAHLDPAERAGLSGLVGLGTAGLLTLLIGLLPNGLGFALYVVLAVFVGLAVLSVRDGFLQGLRPRTQGVYDVLAFAALAIIGLLALVAVLAPSLSTDWDSIAYHLAVPKLWLAAGQVAFIQGIHHSNFPSTMEMLFMWGLEWGGQSGAKAFSLMVYVFGCLALFGLARRWYGRSAGWWAAIGFAGIPVVAWESGTAYIDVAHGLFTALGTIYAAEAFAKESEHKSALVLSGICLGFALGTKYTGLQALVAVAVVVGLAGLLQRDFKLAVRAKLTIAVIALLIACPWYIKTAIYTGNPVYPFFYSVLGGSDWNDWRAAIYKDEQQSFGVGTSPTDIGHAVLGLAYQPGRYTNPGQTTGGGFPTGAIGFACLLAGVCAATCGRLRREERLVLAVVGLGFLMWFFLSQQSRYLTMLAIPLAVLGAGQVSRVKWGPVVAAGFVLQAAATSWLVYRFQGQIQLDVVTGKVTAEEYLRGYFPFYRAAEKINSLPEGSKVALYDEVFGFYLDTPYFWANPGHSMLIPYESLENGEQYIQSLRDLGFTHIYLNMAYADQRFRDALDGTSPYSPQEWESLSPDLNLKWKLLVADAANRQLIRDVEGDSELGLGEIVR